MSDPYVSTLIHPARPVAMQQRVSKVLGSTSAEQLTPTRYRVKAATFTAVKDTNHTANTGTIYIGFDSTSQPIALASGLSLSIAAGVDGWPTDLSKVWLKGTSGDGVEVNFQEGVE